MSDPSSSNTTPISTHSLSVEFLKTADTEIPEVVGINDIDEGEDGTQPFLLSPPKIVPKSVDTKFAKRLLRLARIAWPNWWCKTTLFMIVQVILCVLYAFAYNLYAELNGKFVDAFHKSDTEKFINCLFWMLASAVAGGLSNAACLAFGDILTNNVWCTRITHVLHDLYFNDMIYFKLVHIDKRITDADQRLSADMQVFCSKLKTVLFGAPNFTGIVPDFFVITWFTISLARSVGWFCPVACVGFFIFSTILNKLLMGPAAKAAALHLRRLGEYRFAHTHLRLHCEHVALWNGHECEKEKLSKLLSQVTQSFRSVVFRQFPLNTSSMMFYWGNGLISYLIPAVDRWLFVDSSVTDLECFISTSTVIVSLLGIMSTLLLLFQDISELVGLTSRIGELLEVIEEAKITLQEEKTNTGGGQVLDGDLVKFQNVKCESPDGRALIWNVSFTALPSQSVLIMGPSGSGKSSLLRLLSGLWPLPFGTICRPHNIGTNGIVYMSQQAYLTLGTLKDQITYPRESSLLSEEEMLVLLRLVNLEYLFQRHASIRDSIRDWAELLSSGEAQRLGVARLFFHRSAYAVMDECTSAVDEATEEAIFKELSRRSVVLISVAHRSSVKKYHDWLLLVNSQGTTTFTKLEN